MFTALTVATASIDLVACGEERHGVPDVLAADGRVLETARLALALALVEASNVRATKPSAASRWA
jgi:hypothetical protein